MEIKAEPLSRIGLQESGCQPGDVLDPQGAQKAQTNEALPLGAALEGGHPLVQGGQGLPGAVEELGPEAGQGGVSSRPFKKRYPQLRLQLADGVAQAGLGDAQLLSGLCVVSHLGQPDKIAQVVQIHLPSTPSSPHYTACHK